MFKRIVIISILPVILFLTGLHYRHQLIVYHISTVDPEYAYLYNGLNIARLNFHLGHIDHPGTPVQMTVAFTIRVVHLFSGQGLLSDDVMKNPEKYLLASNLLLIILITVSLFVLGYFVERITKNLALSFLIQLSPFSSYIVMVALGRVTPEPMLLVAVILLIAMSFIYLYSNNEQKQTKHTLFFGIIAGFGLAVKLNFFPLLIIPFILLKNARLKIIYIFTTLASVCVFAFPALMQYGRFRDWIKNLFIHSGQYGQGNANVVDTASFIPNLKSIFASDYIFTLVFFISLLTLIFYFVPFFKLRRKDDKVFRLLLGLFMAISAQLIIVAKHFSLYYMMPSLVLIIPTIFAIVTISSRYFQWITLKHLNITYLIIAIAILALRTRENVQAYNALHDRNTPKMLSIKAVQERCEGKPVIIVPDYYGCAYKEYGNLFGCLLSGSDGGIYRNRIEKIYPSTYFYTAWDKKFYSWTRDYTREEILDKHHKIYLYLGANDNDFHIKILDMFKRYNTTDTLVRMSMVFQNLQTREQMWLVENLSEQPLVLPPLLHILCNAETLSSDKQYLVATNKSYSFVCGGIQDATKAHAGKFAVKLTPDMPYGLTIALDEVLKDDRISITVWRNSADNSGSLVASATSPDGFYANAATGEQKSDNGWEMLRLDFVVPYDLPGNQLKIYVWNNGKNPVWFDDLQIEKYQ